MFKLFFGKYGQSFVNVRTSLLCLKLKKCFKIFVAMFLFAFCAQEIYAQPLSHNDISIAYEILENDNYLLGLSDCKKNRAVNEYSISDLSLSILTDFPEDFDSLSIAQIDSLCLYAYLENDISALATFRKKLVLWNSNISLLDTSDSAMILRLLMADVEWKIGNKTACRRNLDIAYARLSFIKTESTINNVTLSVLNRCFWCNLYFQQTNSALSVLNRLSFMYLKEYASTSENSENKIFNFVSVLNTMDCASMFASEIETLSEVRSSSQKRKVKLAIGVLILILSVFGLIIFVYYKFTMTKRYGHSKKVIEQLAPYINDFDFVVSPDFTLEFLSNCTSLSKKHINDAIAFQCGNMTFTEFRSCRRVQYALDILHDKNDRNKYSMKGIGVKVGFSSSSTFYDKFKSFVGLRPKEYLMILEKAEGTNDQAQIDAVRRDFRSMFLSN